MEDDDDLKCPYCKKAPRGWKMSSPPICLDCGKQYPREAWSAYPEATVTGRFVSSKPNMGDLCPDPESVRPHRLGEDMGSCHTCAMTQEPPEDWPDVPDK